MYLLLQIEEFLIFQMHLRHQNLIFKFLVPGNCPEVIIQNANKTDQTNHQVDQDKNEGKVFTHWRHVAEFKIQYKEHAGINNEHNGMSGKNDRIEKIEGKPEVFFPEQVFWNNDVIDRVSDDECNRHQGSREPQDILPIGGIVAKKIDKEAPDSYPENSMNQNSSKF